MDIRQIITVILITFILTLELLQHLKNLRFIEIKFHHLTPLHIVDMDQNIQQDI